SQSALQSSGAAFDPQRFVSSVLDGVRSLIGVRDAAGRYLFVNSTMAEFHGAPNAAFIGRSPEQIGLPDYAFPTFLRAADGEPFVVRDVPLVDATGHPRRFDVVSRRLK